MQCIMHNFGKVVGGFADFFCFYELCEFLFVGICATPVGVGVRGGVLVRRWLAMGLDHAAVTTS